MGRELGLGLMQVKAPEQAENEFQSAAHWQVRVGVIPECCHQGLAKLGIRTAKAKLRLGPGGEDICAVNYHNTELEANTEWCKLGHGSDGDYHKEEPCHCKEEAQRIIDEKDMEDEFKVLHCEVEDPEPEERRLCMALYPRASCNDNMFDKCVEHKIMHDGSFDGEEGLCIPEDVEKMVRSFQQAKDNGWKNVSLLQESTIEALLRDM